MKITKDCAVQMHYHLTDPDGNVIDSSRGGEPLGYLHGHGNLVAGVEKSLEGRSVGDTFDAIIPPEEGYGTRDPQLDVAIPLTAFPEGARADLVQGARFRGPHPADQQQSAMFMVIKVEDGNVLCTANHPLADVTLHFNIEVVSVREANEGELQAGQFHGDACQTDCC